MPGTAGFAGKFFIFKAAVESRLVWLAIIGVMTTVVSFYYYLYVIVQMYMREPNEEFADVHLAQSLKVALAVTAIGTIYLGIQPTRILKGRGRSGDAPGRTPNCLRQFGVRPQISAPYDTLAKMITSV